MKKILVIGAVILLIVLGFAGYSFMGMANAAKEKAKEAEKNKTKVTRGPLAVRVIETGTIDAVKAVEVKSRVTGRLKHLYVEEGDSVVAGQVIAIIDPQETELQVRQQQAQLRGANSQVARASIEIQQRRETARAAVRQAEIRLAQLKLELKAQPTLTRSSIQQAQAAFETASNELKRLEQTAHPNNRAADQAAMREAEASLKNAEAEFQRQKSLLEQGYTAQKTVENASLQLELARAKLAQVRTSHDRLETQLKLEMERAKDDAQRAKAALDSATANAFQDSVKKREYENALIDLAKAKTALADVDVLIQGRIQSQASVDQLQSSLADGMRQLRETEIRAPMSGVITKKLTQEGELVAGLSSFSSGTGIVRLEDRRNLRIMLNMNEIDTAKLELGLEAKVTVDALPNMTFDGKVRKIAPASTVVGTAAAGSTDNVVKYAVEVWLDRPDPRMRSGMSAKCDLTVSKRDKTLILPLEFVGKDKEGRYVMLPPTNPKDPKTSKRQAVKVGIESGSSIEIVEGVKEGDEVIRPDFKGPKRSGFMSGPSDGDEGGGDQQKQ